MPARSLESLVADKLAEGGGGGSRYIDMRVDLVDEERAVTLYTAGGRWDRKLKRYGGARPNTSRILRTHPGQREAALWLARWLRAHRQNRTMLTPDGLEIYSALLAGGRRSGKTDLATKFAALYAIDRPGTVVWICVPVMPDVPEVQRALEKILPIAWYEELGAPWYRYSLANGSEIHLKSSHDPDSLKRGEADLVVLNEAQKHDERTFAIVRPATADLGGITLMTANPPTTARGEWVHEYREKVQAGALGGVFFDIDPRNNPHVKYASLVAMKNEVDERTYRAEVLGEFLPRVDVVFFAWSDGLNVVAAPASGDVTRAFTRRYFGFEADNILGADFQRTPHMAGVILRAFDDPADPGGEPLLWFVDEVVVDQGDEDELIDALEQKNYTAQNTIMVGDATGEWQDADRTKGRGSFDWFRKRKWIRLYPPDSKMKKNPLIDQRCAAANSRMRSADGKRHLFLDPKCVRLRQALRKWATKHGVPFRQSEYAHIADAATYPIWRFYPRQGPAAKFEYDKVAGKRHSRDEGDDL